DYSYRDFFKDGYGKNYFIDNIADETALDAERARERYLTLNMLLFLQQKLFYRENLDAVKEHQIEDPLQIFVGHTVNPKACAKKDKEDNTKVISDISLLASYYKDFLDGRPKYEAIIKEFVDGKGQFAKGLAARIEWLLENEKDEKAL